MPRLQQGTLCLEAYHPPSKFIQRPAAVSAKLDLVSSFSSYGPHAHEAKEPHETNASRAGTAVETRELCRRRHGISGGGHLINGAGNPVRPHGLSSPSRSDVLLVPAVKISNEPYRSSDDRVRPVVFLYTSGSDFG